MLSKFAPSFQKYSGENVTFEVYGASQTFHTAEFHSSVNSKNTTKIVATGPAKVVHKSDAPNSAIDIDKLVCAEIPNIDLHPLLHKYVTEKHIHGPCGDLNPNCVCMKDGECIKIFPKLGDYISIDDGFELIQYRVGSVLFGSIYLENMLFLFDANDSVAGHIFEEDGYLVPENIPPDHVGWVATRWITVRELILALAFDGFEVIRVEVNV